MSSLTVQVHTAGAGTCEFPIGGPRRIRLEAPNGVRLSVSGPMPWTVTVTPPPGDRIMRIAYLLSVPLRNYHEVIVPDTGRGYCTQTQLVSFWGSTQKSRLNNVRIPLFILTGLDHRPALAFGVIGENFETDFVVEEPAQKRALVAWMRRLTLKIQRGVEGCPIPDSVATRSPDGFVTERLYVRTAPSPRQDTWIATLRDFSRRLARAQGVRPRTTRDSLLPYWCSWTDWFSGDVTEQVILDNVREGLKLGIRNFIIDDGWFGPGLDSEFGADLNIGDWREDPAKIGNLRALVDRMHAIGANAILWCAPHAVAPKANCFEARRRLLIKDASGTYVMTPNQFHSMCFRSPEAREAMADLCADLARRCGVDGSKYDLFNCVPDTPCASDEHTHDTASGVEGLSRTMALIAERTRAVRKDFIIELKQNYATPYLYEHGTCVRAGDTPYNPEGNFLRTAFINAYTPYSVNDYQTIHNYDDPAGAAAMVVKMLAVGIPTYSMDLPTLSQDRKAILRFFHEWYAANLDCFRGFRSPLDPQLRSWRVAGKNKDIYFLLDTEDRLTIARPRACEILVGSFTGQVRLRLPGPASPVRARTSRAGLIVRRRSPACPEGKWERCGRARELILRAEPGEILELRFGAQGARRKGR